MALPIYFYDSIDIINRPLNVNIKVKNIKSMGLGKKIAETKINIEQGQQAIKKYAEEVYAGKTNGQLIEKLAVGLPLTEAMKKIADAQNVNINNLRISSDNFDLNIWQKGENIDKTKLFIENAIDKIKREGMK